MKEFLKGLLGGKHKEEPARKLTKSGLKAGFRELTWGDGPRPGFEVVDTDKEDKFYKRLNENLEFLARPVKEIIYMFYQGRFRAVAIKLPSASADAIHRTLILQMGQPNQPNAGQLAYYWATSGEQESEATTCMLRKGQGQGQDGLLVISSKSIEAKRKVDLGISSTK